MNFGRLQWLNHGQNFQIHQKKKKKQQTLWLGYGLDMITSTKVVAFTCFDPFILAAFSTSLAPCPAMEALCRQTPKAVAALSICSGRPPPRASSLRPRRLRSRWWKAREFPTEVLREFSAELVKVYMVKGRNPKKTLLVP